MSEELKPLDRPWDTAESESIWNISGIYPEVGSTFTNCLAIVAPFYMTGTDEPLFMMISPAIQDGKPIAPKWITNAEPLVLIHKETPLVAFYQDDQAQVDEAFRKDRDWSCVLVRENLSGIFPSEELDPLCDLIHNAPLGGSDE